ncbi:MAG: hypothetical protein DRQ55_11195 [Planctomycetota bacterium]|nr:MAG: hypothetical protein DRQ55_11195 [Planctomycetota bacterium]
MAALTNLEGTQTYVIQAEGDWEMALEASEFPREVLISTQSLVDTMFGTLQYRAQTDEPTGNEGYGHYVSGALVTVLVTNASMEGRVTTQLPIWVRTTPGGGGTPKVTLTVCPAGNGLRRP